MKQLLFINNTLQHVSGIIMPLRQRPPHNAHDVSPGFPRHQPAHQVLKTICSNVRSSAPEDGHNDA